MFGGINLAPPARPRRSFWLAVAAYIGYMMGVGVFSLPYAIGHSGFFLGMAILFLVALVMLTVNTMYADVIVATPGTHRLVGYVRAYLGPRWVGVAHVVNVGAFWGVLIVYAVLGGIFLHTLLHALFPAPLLVFQLAFFFGALLWCLVGIRRIALLEGGLMACFIGGILFLTAKGFTHIQPEVYLTRPTISPVVAYGVILFSFIADGIVPEMKDILGRQARRLRDALVVGSMIATGVYALFTVVVFGVTGAGTTVEGFDGLVSVLGEWVAPFGAVLGLIAVFTSFLLCAVALFHNWHHDLRLHRSAAWMATIAPPLLVLLMANADLIELMAAIGSVFGGMTGIIILCLYVRAREKGAKRSWIVSPPWAYVLGAFLAAGVLIECQRLLLAYAS
jgi:amino acid permease